MSARLDALEGRQLMTASLQAISTVSVPALQGYTVPLLANSGATDAQTFTVTSSNPDITASVAQGPFWTLGVSYKDSTNPADSFTGSLTFQLFQNLTPNTVNMIEQFTNDGFYVNSGDYFPRIVSDFDSPLTTVIQGGATNDNGTGSSGQPNTPFANENVQQLALTGVDQLALANAGGTDTNDTQFFINTGPADALGYNYTVFGQLVAGQSHADADGDSSSGPDELSDRRRFAAGQPPDHHLGVAVVHESRRRRHPRHHAGEAGRDGHHHRHGHRPNRRYDGFAVVQRRGRTLRRADDLFGNRQYQFQAVRESGLDDGV